MAKRYNKYGAHKTTIDGHTFDSAREKGMETDVFKLKRKMFIKKYGDQCDFRIIK